MRQPSWLFWDWLHLSCCSHTWNHLKQVTSDQNAVLGKSPDYWHLFPKVKCVWNQVVDHLNVLNLKNVGLWWMLGQFLRNLLYPNLPFTERGSKRQQTCQRKMDQSTTTTNVSAIGWTTQTNPQGKKHFSCMKHKCLPGVHFRIWSKCYLCPILYVWHSCIKKSMPKGQNKIRFQPVPVWIETKHTLTLNIVVHCTIWICISSISFFFCHPKHQDIINTVISRRPERWFDVP